MKETIKKYWYVVHFLIFGSVFLTVERLRDTLPKFTLLWNFILVAGFISLYYVRKAPINTENNEVQNADLAAYKVVVEKKRRISNTIWIVAWLLIFCVGNTSLYFLSETAKQSFAFYYNIAALFVALLCLVGLILYFFKRRDQ